MAKKPKCKMCKRIVKSTSTHGLCGACQMRKQKMVARQMRNKKGKYFERWKEGLLNSFGQKWK